VQNKEAIVSETITESAHCDITTTVPPKKKRKAKSMLPKAVPVPGEKKENRGGKTIYFGIDAGIRGQSPGLIHKHAHLLQYLLIYRKDKSFLPKCIVEQVYFNMVLYYKS
jgi:hypothetical protein